MYKIKLYIGDSAENTYLFFLFFIDYLLVTEHKMTIFAPV